MEPDQKGFLYPIINQDICIDCGLCRKICPQVERVAPTKRESRVLAALAIDDNLRAKSSSGGIFSLLAEQTLHDGGVVFGAALANDLLVQHIMVDASEDLAELRGSKYVQSRIGDCYRQVIKFLKQGKKVLFSGTPCQVDALKHFLRNEYDNLITVDILCHGVPSQKVLTKFIKAKEATNKKKVVNINFREKDPGWTTFSTTIQYEDGTKEIDNSFYHFFINDFCLRDSCSQCLYSSINRSGDISLGDFWGYAESAPEHIENDDLGISLVLINTKKGEKSFQKVNRLLDSATRSINDAVKGNRVLEGPFLPNERSKEFWEDFEKMTWDELVEKYNISRKKKPDQISSEDRLYYAKPYKKRHKRHLIHCLRMNLIKKLGK